jgi:septal ring factor EnvC (AmiA/AmiB activator)
MIEKFPGVNFTLDSIQSYHKGRVVINKAVSEVTSSSVDKDIDFPSDDEDTNNNNNKPKPKPMQNASVATKLETTFKKTLETNMKEIDEEIARLQAEKKQIEEQLAVLNLALGELNIGSNQKSKK